MSTEKFFTVIAGRKEPVEVLQGTLNKTTGLPDPSAQKVAVTVGKVLIPNYATAWGKRVAPEKASAKASLAVNDPAYKGEIKFLTYGADGGELVELRWLPNSKSLDKVYQDTVLKLKMREEDVFLELEQGLNNFDTAIHAVKIEMLKHHGLMKDNESKDPTENDYDMVTYDPAGRNKNRISALLLKGVANNYVLDARQNPGKTAILAAIFGEDPKQQDDIIIERLLDRSEEFPERFVEKVNEFITKGIVTLQDAENVGIVNMEPEGDVLFIVNNSGKKDILVSKVEGKGQDRFNWIAQTALTETKVFDALNRVEKELTQFRRIKEN